MVGANASGKSNFLDAFRFLRDVARPEGGGIQKAVKDRGGVSKIRCLAARTDPVIEIEITLIDENNNDVAWEYLLAIRQEQRGHRLPYIVKERVKRSGKILLNRPNPQDRSDPLRLTQTYLEQVNENGKFREIVRYFENIRYLHLVPQLLRHSDEFQGRQLDSDPFGQGFLEQVAKTPQRTQKARLKRIERALKIAVPQLEQLRFERDENTGRPHLAALHSHWRPKAGWQREDQFSDGTLRLIGLLWALLDGDSLLLLEEPELSLNASIVRRMAPLIFQLQRLRRRQVIISTHSMDLLSDPGIDGREILLLEPSAEGTAITAVSQIADLSRLLGAGLTAGEVVLPRTRPSQLDFFSSLGS